MTRRELIAELLNGKMVDMDAPVFISIEGHPVSLIKKVKDDDQVVYLRDWEKLPVGFEVKKV